MRLFINANIFSFAPSLREPCFVPNEHTEYSLRISLDVLDKQSKRAEQTVKVSRFKLILVTAIIRAVLCTVVSQQLLPDVDGGQVAAFEILQMTGAVRSMIRDSKNHMIPGAIAAGNAEGMVSMDQSILRLYQKGKITRQTALSYADNPEQMLRRIGD